MTHYLPPTQQFEEISQNQIVSLNKMKGENDQLLNINVYAHHPQTIYPKNFNLSSLFKDHFYVYLSPSEPKKGNDGTYNLPEGTVSKKVKMIKIQDKILKKHKDDVLVSTHLFNWEMFVNLHNPTFEDICKIYWITVKIDNEVLGPPQIFEFTQTKEFKEIVIGLSEYYNDFDESTPEKTIFLNVDENKELPKEEIKEIEMDYDKLKPKQNQLDMNILHYISSFKNQESIDLLTKLAPLSKDIINKQDSYGNTPLHYSQEFKNEAGCQILMSNGADNKIRNKNGFSYLDNLLAKEPSEKFYDLCSLKHIQMDSKISSELVFTLTNQNELKKYYLNKNSKELLDYNEKLKSINGFYIEKTSQTISNIVRKGKPNALKTDPVELDFITEIKKGEVENEKLGLRLLLVESHNLNSISNESMLDTLSPFSTMIKQRNTKSYQFVVCMGPWILEWNETSFVIPKRAFFNSSYYATETGYYIGNLDCEFSINETAKFIAYWNKTRVYDKTNCHSQTFVDSLFKALTNRTLRGHNLNTFREFGVKLKSEVIIPEKIMNIILGKSMSQSEIIETPLPKEEIEFKTHYEKQETFKNILSKRVEFKTHRDIDEFMKYLKVCKITDDNLNANPEFYFILKSIDRLFWLKHFDGSTLFHIFYRIPEEEETENSPLKNHSHLDVCHFGDISKVSSSRNYYKWWSNKE